MDSSAPMKTGSEEGQLGCGRFGKTFQALYPKGGCAVNPRFLMHFINVLIIPACEHAWPAVHEWTFLAGWMGLDVGR